MVSSSRIKISAQAQAAVQFALGDLGHPTDDESGTRGLGGSAHVSGSRYDITVLGFEHSFLHF